VTGSPPARKATALQLVFLTYAVICSGAYGLEEMVGSAGPGMALVTLIVLPFVWAAPIALACAELAARHPVEGGYYRWARLAFGDFVGYLAGWLIWVANFTTNAAFAVLFASYLRYWVPEMSRLAHFLIAASLVWFTTFLNWRGITLVGRAAVALTLFVFTPFVLLTVMGLWGWRFDPFVPFVNPEHDTLSAFAAGLGIAIWLYSGFEKLTVNAEEVENPARAFPLALALAVPMVAASYVLPTLAALAASGDWSAWGEAYFSQAAANVGGPALGHLMAAGALASNACILMVTTLGQSRLPMVLAEDGLFPRAFARQHPRFGTPVVSLLVGAIVLTALSGLRFAHLAGLFSLVQAMAYMLIYATLLRLRRRATQEGATHGGFRIPLGNGGLVALMVPSVILAVLVLLSSVWHDGAFDGRQALVDAVVLASGPLTYFWFRRGRSA